MKLPRVIQLAVALAPLLWAAHSHAQNNGPARVQAVRFWSFGDVTRIAVQTQGDYKVTSDQIENPARVYFDLNGLRPPASSHRGIQTIRVGDQRVKQIRVAEVSPGKTRIVFDLEGPAEVISSQLVNPDRLMIEIRPRGVVPAALSVPHSNTASQAINLSASDDQPNSITPSELAPPAIPVRTTTVQTPDGLVVQRAYKADVTVPAPTPVSAPPPAPAPISTISTKPVTKVVGVAAPAKKDSAGDRSLVRVFGLKLGKVVIDAGHGGHDTGTIGPNGLMEKDLVLDVALRLGTLITQQMGAQVVYTRSDDTFIPLEERTKIANDEKADLFISIHANSSPEPSATGVETYFFNLTSDRAGLDLATRENATSGSSISDLNDLLHKAVLEAKLEESREFAQRVQTCLWSSSLKMNSRSRDRGVRQAPFVVLIGATMPSILAEIGFVSNPHDEKLLRRPDQRQRIAEALFKGISQYASTLSHVQIARSGSE